MSGAVALALLIPSRSEAVRVFEDSTDGAVPIQPTRRTPPVAAPDAATASPAPIADRSPAPSNAPSSSPAPDTVLPASAGPNASPEPGAPPSPSPSPLTVALTAAVSVLTEPGATPDVRPGPDTPIAAGGSAGSSRYPAGSSTRWFDLSMYLQPQLAIQTGYDSSRTGNFSIPPSFSLTRMRIILHAQPIWLLQLRVEANISDRVTLLDAYALAPIHRAFNIQAGQFRVPFSRAELISGARYQLPTASLWAGSANQSGVRFIPSFDIGLMAWGWLGPGDLVEYYAGVFNGEGANQLQNQDGYFLYAGRIAINPLGRPPLQESALNVHSPRVALGLNANGQIRSLGTAMVGGQQVANLEHVVTVGADLAAFGWGASLYVEFYYRDLRETDTVAAPSTEAIGWLIQAGYFPPLPYVRDHLEIAARVQDFDPSACVTRAVGNDCGIRLISSRTPEVYRDFQHTRAITIGLNWYQLGHGYKVQASYTLNYDLKGIQDMPPETGRVAHDIFLLQLTGAF